VRPGVQRIEEPHHPRGYRELRSSAEMRRLLNRKIVEQDRICTICHEEFTDYNECRARPYRSQRDGRSLERRPSGQHPSRSLVVQFREGVDQSRQLIAIQSSSFLLPELNPQVTRQVDGGVPNSTQACRFLRYTGHRHKIFGEARAFGSYRRYRHVTFQWRQAFNHRKDGGRRVSWQPP
jgi:hypothetical protein